MADEDSVAPDPFGAGWARPVSTRDRWVDAALGLGLLVTACVSLASSSLGQDAGAQPPLWLAGAWVTALTAPLVLRRRFPLAVACVVAAAFEVGEAAGIREHVVDQVCLFLVLYTAGAWTSGRRATVVVRAVVVAAVLVALVVQLVPEVRGLDSGERVPGAAALGLNVLQNLAFLAGSVALGETARLSARRLAALRVRTAQLAAERERTAAQAAAQAVSDERVRIARELHDVVGHHVSVMGLQAGAARRVVVTAPDRAATALSSIEDSARTAVEEMHRMLVTLRGDEAPTGGPATSQAPSAVGVRQLQALAAEARDGGTPVELTTLGVERAVPATTGLTLYRVLQEALTNVRKHAGAGVPAEVRLRYHRAFVELEVVDHGGPAGPAVVQRAGLGLVGMRERVAAVGGSIETGPAATGFRVHATLPLPVAPAEEEVRRAP